MEQFTGTTLITGVSGFVGARLARALADTGAQVVGLSRTVPAIHHHLADVPHVAVDLTDFDAVCAAIRQYTPQTVYHLAATSVLHAVAQEGGARAMLESNVRATGNLLEACRIAQTPAVIVTSSDKQYGALAPPPYDDDDTTALENGGVYELSKAQQDQTARLYAGLYDVPAVRVARLVNVYGPGDTQWTRIIPGTIRRAVNHEPPRITSGRAGQSLREYVFVDDAVTALQFLAHDAHTRGNAPLRRTDGRLARVAFNVGSGVHLAAGDVIQTILRLLREEFGIDAPEPITAPGTPGVFEPGSQFCRLDKLRALIPDYDPVGFEDGLRKTIPWYLSLLTGTT